MSQRARFAISKVCPLRLGHVSGVTRKLLTRPLCLIGIFLLVGVLSCIGAPSKAESAEVCAGTLTAGNLAVLVRFAQERGNVDIDNPICTYKSESGSVPQVANGYIMQNYVRIQNTKYWGIAVDSNPNLVDVFSGLDFEYLVHRSVDLPFTSDGEWNGQFAIIRPDSDDSRPGVTLSSNSLTIEEEGSGSYTVVLESNPDGPVSIALSSDNGDVTVSPGSLSFDANNWDSLQIVTVSAAHDDDAVDDTATINHAVTGYGNVTNRAAVSWSVSTITKSRVWACL